MTRLYIVLFFLFLSSLGSVYPQGGFYKSIYQPSIVSNTFHIAGLAAVPASHDFVTYYHLLDSAKNTLVPQLVKYNLCNEVVFHKDINLSLVYDVRIFNDHNNEMLVLGDFKNRVTNATDNMICKLNNSGELVDSYEIRNRDKKATMRIRELELIHDSVIYMGGIIERPGNNLTNKTGYFLAKLDQNLNVLWAKSYKTAISNPKKMTALANGEVIVSHLSNNQIVCINPDGSVKWVKKFSQNKQQLTDTDPVEVDDGIVFSVISKTNKTSFCLVKLDYNGNLVWVSEGVNPNYAFEIALTYLKDSQRLMYVTTKNNGDLANHNELIKMVHEYDNNGNIVNQVRWQPDKAHTARVINATTLIDKYALVIGIEGDTSTKENRISVHKFDDFSKLLNCSFTIHTDKLARQDLLLKDGSVHVVGVNIELIPSFHIQLSEASMIENNSCHDTTAIGVDLGPDKYLCHGESVLLSSNFNYPAYQWSNGETTKSIRVNKAGKYWLETGSDCSKASDTIEVFVLDRTMPQYNITPKTGKVGDQFSFASLNSNLTGLSWQIDGKFFTNSATFMHSFSAPGRYRIGYLILDENGCRFQDSTFIEITEIPVIITPANKPNYYVPNSFTPNGDGINDEFGPIGTGLKSFNLQVYDRWGRLLFNENNTYWKGLNLSVDRYVYKLEVIDDFGDVTRRTGEIYLLH